MDLGAVAFCMLISFSLGAFVAAACMDHGHHLAANDNIEEEETNGSN